MGSCETSCTIDQNTYCCDTDLCNAYELPAQFVSPFAGFNKSNRLKFLNSLCIFLIFGYSDFKVYLLIILPI